MTEAIRTIRGLIAWWIMLPMLGRVDPRRRMMGWLLGHAGDWIYREERRALMALAPAPPDVGKEGKF